MLNKLKNQLTLWYSLGILAAIVFFLVFFFSATNAVFYAQIDEILKTHVNSLVASLENDHKIAGCGCLSPESPLLLGVLQMPGMPTAILNEKGQVIKSSVDWSLSLQSPQFYRFFKSPVKNNGQVIGSVLMGHPIDAFLKTRSILIIVIIIIIFIIFIPVILLGRFLAQKALSKEKQFLTDLTHSLKTPLAVLQSQLENSPSDKFVQFDQFDKSALLLQVKKLSSLVNETLESNYLVSNQKKVKTDLTALMRELCEITQALGLEKKIILTQNLPSTSLWVKGGKQQLAKAFLSVLENAVHYGKRNGKIEVTLSKNNPASAGSRHWRDNQAIVTIADNGIGIDKEDLPYVFDRFYRGKNLKNAGHGLGLSIAKNIIEELGGEISIESELNKGTSVIITL